MFVVRHAKLADARGIATIHVRSWQSAYLGIVPHEFLQALSIEKRTSTWREALSSGTSAVWVAEENERLLGWISIGKSRDSDATAETAELWAVYVDPSECCRGVGRALWVQAERHFTSAKFSEVTLWVLEKNHGARRFYDRLGFQPEPDRAKTLEIGGAQLVEIRLRRNIRS